jgi:glycosyltransferase involved in cell wall biosynthesis
MLAFISAVYNEREELPDLLTHVEPYVDIIRIVDDGSTDETRTYLKYWTYDPWVDYDWKTIPHTGLPETVKREAVNMVPDDVWVIMLDADERFEEGALQKIIEWVHSGPPANITHVYFTKNESLDERQVRSFQKVHLFRKSAVTFSDIIHVDDTYIGDPINIGLTVLHRKTSDKQRKREKEYLDTYARLVAEGKMTQEKADWCRSLHYFER